MSIVSDFGSLGHMPKYGLTGSHTELRVNPQNGREFFVDIHLTGN